MNTLGHIQGRTQTHPRSPCIVCAAAGAISGGVMVSLIWLIVCWLR